MQNQLDVAIFVMLFLVISISIIMILFKITISSNSSYRYRRDSARSLQIIGVTTLVEGFLSGLLMSSFFLFALGVFIGMLSIYL